jgi:tellurite resistance protein
MTSIAQAAALMARADGQADETERKALLHFLRNHDLLRRFGRRAWMTAYNSELDRNPSASDVLDTLGKQRGQTTAPLIASAAMSVALADGTAHQGEVDLLRNIAERLSLVGTIEQSLEPA